MTGAPRPEIPVLLLDIGWDRADLVAVLLPGPHGAAECLEGGVEERFHVVGLEAGGFGAFHLAAHLVDLTVGEHGGHELVGGQGFCDAVAEVGVHRLDKGGLGFGGVAFHDRPDHQVT